MNKGGNPMATASFFKTFGVETQEEVDRFIEIISQPPKPISDEIRKLGEENDKNKEETLELLKRALSR
jgi:cell division septum initiation protein DivIVA